MRVGKLKCTESRGLSLQYINFLVFLTQVHTARINLGTGSADSQPDHWASSSAPAPQPHVPRRSVGTSVPEPLHPAPGKEGMSPWVFKREVNSPREDPPGARHAPVCIPQAVLGQGQQSKGQLGARSQAPPPTSSMAWASDPASPQRVLMVRWPDAHRCHPGRLGAHVSTARHSSLVHSRHPWVSLSPA